MIKLIENLGDKVIGFDFSDNVTAKEYEEIIFPAIENHSKNQSKMRLVCHFANKTRFDFGAMWDDTVMGLKHYFNWGKIAIVSDIGWLNHTLEVMGFLLPGHMKTYCNGEFQKAIDWLNED